MREYEGCGVCKHTDVDAKEYPCKECIHNVATITDHYEPMTNADRIRNMTDEELAEFITDAENYGYNGTSIAGYDHECGCYRDMLEWLQAEVKEGGSDE